MTTLQSPKQDLFDLVVIGGGINGAAIARDAALRNLKVVLLEKNDFGSGASSKTSKLAHGGVRYLEQFQFGLVRESLKERSLLLKNAPHLVKPLSFLMPVYSQDPHSLWKIHLGLYVYDYLAGDSLMPNHTKLTADVILKMVPALQSDGLKGGCSYYDAQMLDNRIVIENILSAEKAGALVRNHTEVTGLVKELDRVTGVSYIDTRTGEKGVYIGKAIVNATGAWSAEVGKMEPNTFHCSPEPTKGVHLVLPCIIPDVALLLRAPQDGRVFFILPWGKFSIVGTTDTFYGGNPDRLTIEDEDRAYLLNALNAFFPRLQYTEASIISSFVGLRPLVAANKKNDPSGITREHVIQVSKGGMITVLGGKFTTHRLIAKEVVDVVLSQNLFARDIASKAFLKCSTAFVPFPGALGPFTLNEVGQKLMNSGVNVGLATHLLGIYGTRSLDILDIIQKDSREAELIAKDHPHILAEITYSVLNEHVKTAEDWFLRSTSIHPCHPDQKYTDKVVEKIEILTNNNNCV
ncbi:MAG TPA: glycerol-3-phosphate dehydrogenase/oxidase [Parachlamydiaceae bacterium]|nr:glycerol-3-phosphate dehydrogenase/oxidase [Parachlamydiaceae bacterium]